MALALTLGLDVDHCALALHDFVQDAVGLKLIDWHEAGQHALDLDEVD